MAGLLTADDVAFLTATTLSAMDSSLPLYRNTALGTSNDGYGHSIPSWPQTPTATIACSAIRPSSTVLQAYAGIIGSKRTIVLRVLNATDIREGDRIIYQGLQYEVQTLVDDEDYTVTKKYLMTVVG